MATGATGRKTRLDVIGIIRGGEILGMAAHAISRSSLEIAARVARRALQVGMHAGQGKAGKAQVIKLGTEPRVHAVARLASRGETGGGMVGIGGLLELGGMATDAIGGESLELAHRRILVAAVALQQCMRSHQRKAVEVLLHGLHPDPPALYRVAIFATGAELAPMDIRVAVRALRARVPEHQVGMALPAGDPFMHPAQGKLGLVVIKLRDIADRLPGCEAVTILARQIQITVGAARSGLALAGCLRGVARRLRRQSSRSTQQEPDDQVYQQCRAQGISLVLLMSHESGY